MKNSKKETVITEETKGITDIRNSCKRISKLMILPSEMFVTLGVNRKQMVQKEVEKLVKLIDSI